MISAIQNSPVNTPKPQCKVAFGNKYDKVIKYGPKDFFCKSCSPLEKNSINIPEDSTSKFEKFIKWLVGFKG